MTTVKAGAPLSGLDKHVFLGGVLVDPAEISYEILGPDSMIADDEDGVPITARAPVQRSIGNYHAGNTVLAGDAALGAYTIVWRVRKLPAGSIVDHPAEFEIAAELEDATREGVSRRDVSDTEAVTALRALIHDNAADDTRWAFFNSELATMVEHAVIRHTSGRRTLAIAVGDDLSMSLMLAQCAALQSLAADRSRFFRWQDGSEAVDKSMQPASLVAICNSIMAQYRALVQKRLDEDDRALDQARAGRLMVFRRR